jgi:hypothetical protein
LCGSCFDFEGMMMSETITTLPSRGALGTRITLKSCNGNAVTGIVIPECVLVDGDDFLLAKWELVENTPNSVTYRMEIDERFYERRA